MELMKAIAARRSVRSYKQEQISDEQLDSILKAGCAAPVGKNLYENLRITVIQDNSVLSEISSHLMAMMHTEDDPLYGAPTLIIISSKPMPFPGIELADTGCILENMMLEATEQGLGSVVIWSSGMAVNTIPGLKEKLSLPDEYTTVAGIVTGYAGTQPQEKEMALSIHVDRL